MMSEELRGTDDVSTDVTDESDDSQEDVAALKGKAKDLEKRLGDAVRVGGQRLIDYKREVEAWATGVEQATTEAVDKARKEAYEEGVKFAEERLLSRVAVEDKAEYLEEVRYSSAKPTGSGDPPVRFAASKQVSNETSAAMARSFTALGVPPDEIDQTSDEAVIESVSKWFSTKLTKVEQLEEKLKALEERGGDRRVSRGASGASLTPATKLQSQIEDIDQRLREAKRRHKVDEASALLRQRKDLVAELDDLRSTQR